MADVILVHRVHGVFQLHCYFLDKFLWESLKLTFLLKLLQAAALAQLHHNESFVFFFGLADESDNIF